MSPRRILIVAPPLVTLQDVTGPWEVFSRAAVRLGPGAYSVETASAGQERRMGTKFGLEMICGATLEEIEGEIDTLLIAGGAQSAEAPDPALSAWLRVAAPGVRRLGSICTGAFHLADAGLLAGRRATTHWRYCAALADRFPDIAVDREPIYVRDGAVYTSAGITAGIDLALALVEEDHGHALAHDIARELVVFLRRPADQSQISAALARQMAARSSIRELQLWLPDHLSAPLSVEELAELVHMSPRSFARAFAAEVGATPGEYVERLRIEAASRRLQQGPESLDAIAASCGFGSLRTMDRAFKKRLGLTPAQYRTSRPL